MAVESGLGLDVRVDDHSGDVQNLSNDIQSCDFGTPRGVQDVTGLDKSAKETILLLADFTITLTGTFNDATDRSHAVFKTVPSASVVRTVRIELSSQNISNEVNFTDYSFSRGADGSMIWTAPGVLATGVVPTWS